MMIGELINGAYFVLGELKGSTRPGLWLAHSLVTGELVTLAVPAPKGESPTADDLRRGIGLNVAGIVEMLVERGLL